MKVGIKLIPSTFKARNLIKKLDVDFVVGVLGGGAIVASTGGKFAGKPTFSIILTPQDSKVCPKFNHFFVLPEMDKFKSEKLPKNMEKSFYPLNDKIVERDAQIAKDNLKKHQNFDENKKL